jgi:NADPH-dependent 2,4-dienoyl-CoA reductase/sulfur reductase-like enzyme
MIHESSIIFSLSMENVHFRSIFALEALTHVFFESTTPSRLSPSSTQLTIMKKYDIIVIGSGAGMHLASAAYERGMKVAVIEHGPMGGTCLNRGCIPTKILTSHA